jgi:hypothetical protein
MGHWSTPKEYKILTSPFSILTPKLLNILWMWFCHCEPWHKFIDLIGYVCNESCSCDLYVLWNCDCGNAWVDVASLTLGFWSSLTLGSWSSWEIFNDLHILTSARESKRGEFGTFLNVRLHFWNWNLAMSWIFGTKVKIIKLVHFGSILYNWKVLEM